MHERNDSTYHWPAKFEVVTEKTSRAEEIVCILHEQRVEDGGWQLNMSKVSRTAVVRLLTCCATARRSKDIQIL